LIATTVVLAASTACRRTQSIEAAIAKQRGSLVAQVNAAGDGAPFFTVDTLNPIWAADGPTPIVTIPELQLVDQDARTRDRTAFTGRTTFVGFFFATCQGFCPFLIEGMKGVADELADLKGSVRFVALSVNPETDTPERLTQYAERRGLDTKGDWTLLTGSRDVIHGLAKKTFASQVFQRPGQDANFVHSEHLYVLDEQGRLRGILNGTRTDLRRDARALVDQLRAATKVAAGAGKDGTAAR
jgi:protein SCO1/2